MKSKVAKGNVERMVAALRILNTVPEANFLTSAVDYGKPLVVDAKGRCKTKCNAAGFIIQNDVFKKAGAGFEQHGAKGLYTPVFHIKETKSRLTGMVAVSRVFEMDYAICTRVFADGTKAEVMRRLRIATTKAGGGEALKKFDDSLKPAPVKKLEKEKAKAKKKAAKKKTAAKK